MDWCCGALGDRLWTTCESWELAFGSIQLDLLLQTAPVDDGRPGTKQIVLMYYYYY